MEGELKEVELAEAKKIAKDSGSKFVWLGSPVKISLSSALGIKPDQLLEFDPHEIISMPDEKLRMLKNDVFVCYHGITSAAMVKYLKSKKNIDGYSLKGGITAIVGENY
ncbi:MAG: rhodanese-like domain-containing protein [Candidatus Micrarchaeota archaeon]|nr:rhodanese-like domain-containing protein [Candidatus Micrarchaeota archaeon]